jgi:hypothetical protein
VGVALHEPDRKGNPRKWHAHLLATTRQVTAHGLGEKCAIEWADFRVPQVKLGWKVVQMERRGTATDS